MPEPTPSPSRFFILIHGTPETEMEITSSAFSVGRDADNDLVIEHPQVSRHHCRFFQQDGRWQVEDLGSRNGVAVNTAVVKTSPPLNPGDVVRIGSATAGSAPVIVVSGAAPDRQAETRYIPSTGVAVNLPMLPVWKRDRRSFVQTFGLGLGIGVLLTAAVWWLHAPAPVAPGTAAGTVPGIFAGTDNAESRGREADRYLRACPVDVELREMIQVSAKDIPAEARKSFVDAMAATLDRQKIRGLMREALVRQLTAAELTALADFSSTTTGMKAGAGLAAVTAATAPAIRTEFTDTMQRIFRKPPAP